MFPVDPVCSGIERGFSSSTPIHAVTRSDDFTLVCGKTPAVTPNSGKAFQTYQHICAYMTENFTAAITRESVAEEMRLNPSHISKLFRQFSELSFNQMLRKLRMEWAMELLQEKNWTIKEIADQCGYSSVDYFIESFKQYYGQTPGRLRQ